MIFNEKQGRSSAQIFRGQRYKTYCTIVGGVHYSWTRCGSEILTFQSSRMANGVMLCYYCFFSTCAEFVLHHDKKNYLKGRDLDDLADWFKNHQKSGNTHQKYIFFFDLPKSILVKMDWERYGMLRFQYNWLLQFSSLMVLLSNITGWKIRNDEELFI